MAESSSTPRDTQPRWVSLRSERDLRGLERAAALAWRAARQSLCGLRPGMTTGEVGELARAAIVAGGGRPVFEGYRPSAGERPFPGAACVSVNDECVHTPPGGRVLAPGDLVTVDAGVELDGWCGDVADSAVVPGGGPAPGLLAASRRAVAAGIRACRPGARWSEAARAVRASAAADGLVVLAELSGHGVGRALHEPPSAGYQTRAGGAGDFALLPGMVLTIEPVLLAPPGRATRDDDGWTVRTADGSWSCHAERMVAVTRRGPRILGLSGRCSGPGGGL